MSSITAEQVVKRRQMAAIQILARGDPMHSVDDRMDQIASILKEGLPKPRRKKATRRRETGGQDRMETGGETRDDGG